MILGLTSSISLLTWSSSWWHLSKSMNDLQAGVWLFPLLMTMASLVTQIVNNLPAIWETQVQSLGWKDSLEKGKATQPSILAWRVTWTEEPGGLQSMELQRVEHDWATNIFIFTSHDINPHTSPMRWASSQLYRWRPSDSKTWNRGPGVTQLVRGIMGVESLSSWFQYLAVNPYILLWVYYTKPWTRY